MIRASGTELNVTEHFCSGLPPSDGGIGSDTVHIASGRCTSTRVSRVKEAEGITGSIVPLEARLTRGYIVVGQTNPEL